MLRLLVMTLVIFMLYLPDNTEEASVEVNTTATGSCAKAWSPAVKQFEKNCLCKDCFDEKKTQAFAKDLADGESRTVFLKLFDQDLTYKTKAETCTAEDVLMGKVWTCTKVKGQEIECKLDEEETGKRCTISFKNELEGKKEPIIKRYCEDADLCNDKDSKRTIFEWNHFCTESCCPENNKDGPLRASLTFKDITPKENDVLITNQKPARYQWEEDLSPKKNKPRFKCVAQEIIKINYFWRCSNLQNDWTIVQKSPECVQEQLINKECTVKWDATTGLLTEFEDSCH